MDKHTKGKLLLSILWIILLLFLASQAMSCKAWAMSDEQIVNAIFKAEGGYKATYLYGIRSVKYKDEADARQICLNTIRNNRKRYADYGYKTYDTYLEFLASRYCPIGCDNDTGTNKHWVKNVEYFLEQE